MRIDTNLAMAIAKLNRHKYEKEIMIPRWQIFGAALGIGYQWPGTTTPQEELTLKRPVIMQQGRVLGGGASLNFMVWGRGTPAEYDAWEEWGNPGWGWEGLLPYFKKVSSSWFASLCSAMRTGGKRTCLRAAREKGSIMC